MTFIFIIIFFIYICLCMFGLHVFDIFFTFFLANSTDGLREMVFFKFCGLKFSLVLNQSQLSQPAYSSLRKETKHFMQVQTIIFE